jgi:hypothetical protein
MLLNQKKGTELSENRWIGIFCDPLEQMIIALYASWHGSPGKAKISHSDSEMDSISALANLAGKCCNQFEASLLIGHFKMISDS